MEYSIEMIGIFDLLELKVVVSQINDLETLCFTKLEDYIRVGAP